MPVFGLTIVNAPVYLDKLMRTWKVLSGDKPPDTHDVELQCLGCGTGALVPVVGIPIAQLHQGLVFDSGVYWMPSKIQCRHCRRILSTEEAA